MIDFNKKDLTPKEIVKFMNNFIIGQTEAKRAVAIAFRNRWRRLQIQDEFLRNEITPKNILMKGATGVGKTEIARRLAKISNSPFIKVEATKFTQVGYVGRDVDSIIRDLVEISFKQVQEIATEKIKKEAHEYAVNQVIDNFKPTDESERKKLELRIKAGELDDEEIKIKSKKKPSRQIGINIQGNSLDFLQNELGKSFEDLITGLENNVNKSEKQKSNVALAVENFEQEYVEENLNREEMIQLAIKLAEESGIVFIDEIDKIAGSSMLDRNDISRQGVQRDLLPLIEGTTINTKYGSCKTNHILFVASGAFHFADISDLIPEMQGRLPVKVVLNNLTVDDYYAILSNTENSLIKQYQALLETEGLKVMFKKEAIQRIAELAIEFNTQLENIGARRLHSILEMVVENISYKADEMNGKSHTFTKKDVDDAIGSSNIEESNNRVLL